MMDERPAPKNNNKIYCIAEIASKVCTIALSPLNLQSSFKKLGIFSFILDEFDKNKIKPSIHSFLKISTQQQTVTITKSTI
jgi:hypothetical protein